MTKRFFTVALIIALSCTMACAQLGRQKIKGKPSPHPVHKTKTKVDNSPTIGKSDYTPEIKTFEVNGVVFNMVEVRGGSFRMGATSEQELRGDDEKPIHNVTLDSYYIGETEVTQALWDAVWGESFSKFVRENEDSIHAVGDDYPVYYVSWSDCQYFISKLNELTGENFHLPTEAEWEFACRGGIKSRGYKFSGSNDINRVAWYGDISGDNVHPVGTKMPNELGIYDMSGNVLEWCSDWFGKYSGASQHSPAGPLDGTYRVTRGGACGLPAWKCLASWRGNVYPREIHHRVGFRLAL